MKILEKGSIVRLKSGGPKMTVTNIDKEDIHTAWFNSIDSLQSSFFPNYVLKVLR